MFASRLRMAREKRNHSQTSLGELIDVAPQHVQRWEAGRHMPNLETIGRIAKALNVSSDFLLGLTSEMDAYLDELTITEKAVIEAMRRGDSLEAIHVISGAKARG